MNRTIEILKQYEPNLDHPRYYFDSDVLKSMQQYAKECVIASLEKAAESAELEYIKHLHERPHVDKDSITNPENIVLL